MKKVAILFILAGLLLAFSGCAKDDSIVFSFDATDVASIESYFISNNNGSEMQKKTIASKSDIDYLYTFFSELPVNNRNAHSTNGSITLKYVFNLADGTSYELNYKGIATKNGYLQFGGVDYFTSSDIIGIWENLPFEIENITVTNISESK